MQVNNLEAALMAEQQNRLRYITYPNFTRTPPEVDKDKQANCVDWAYYLGNILKNRYNIPVRFIWAKVQVKNRIDNHVWVQSLRDKTHPLDLDPTSKQHRPGDTYQIIKNLGVFKELTAFGAPTLKKGARYV